MYISLFLMSSKKISNKNRYWSPFIYTLGRIALLSHSIFGTLKKPIVDYSKVLTYSKQAIISFFKKLIQYNILFLMHACKTYYLLYTITLKKLLLFSFIEGQFIEHCLQVDGNKLAQTNESSAKLPCVGQSTND